MMAASKSDYYKYIRIRDDNGDNKGAVDLLNFPAVQQEESQEYAVFMDILEKRFFGKQILALQEYDFPSPLQGQLKEMRTATFRRVYPIEDFINPLDEPSRTIPYKFAVRHSFVYKDGDNLCIARLSENPAEGSMMAKETLYDITSLDDSNKKEIMSAIGENTYVDNSVFRTVKSMLAGKGCCLGEEIGNLYKEKTTRKMTGESVKDIYLPARYRNAGSLSALDAVLAHGTVGDLVDVEAVAVPGVGFTGYHVVVYTENEFLQTIKRGNKEVVTCLGNSFSVTPFDGFSKGAATVWKDGNADYGIKGGDVAVRSVENSEKTVFPDGSEVVTEKVSVSRILPVKGKAEKVAARLKETLPVKRPPKILVDLRILSGIHSWEGYMEALETAKPCIEESRKDIVSIRKAVDRACPSLDGIRKVFCAYARAKGMVVADKLINALSQKNFRQHAICKLVEPAKNKHRDTGNNIDVDIKK